MSKMKYILGTATIVLIVGGTIYSIKKSRDLKKLEEEAISPEEARDMVRTKQSHEMSEDEMEEIVDECRDTASWNASFSPPTDTKKVAEEFKDWYEKNKHVILVNPDEIDEYEEEDLPMDADPHEFDQDKFDVVLSEDLTEEDKVLRHDPNSPEALKQFIDMELADLDYMSDQYQTMYRLFDHLFVPENDGDHMLMTKIIDYRVGFFGYSSKWVNEITFADIIIHFARLTDYNCGEGVKYWIHYFLDFNGINHTLPGTYIDKVIKDMNNHIYYNDENETFGIFGLTRYAMDQAIEVAKRNVDQNVTYEIEFNQFLTTII